MCAVDAPQTTILIAILIAHSARVLFQPMGKPAPHVPLESSSMVRRVLLAQATRLNVQPVTQYLVVVIFAAPIIILLTSMAASNANYARALFRPMVLLVLHAPLVSTSMAQVVQLALAKHQTASPVTQYLAFVVLAARDKFLMAASNANYARVLLQQTALHAIHAPLATTSTAPVV